MRSRIEWLDSLRGLGIMLVVWAHLNLPMEAETIIYSFHMPLFFFISGYLFKGGDRSLSEVLKKKFSNLLVPYLFFGLLSIPFGIILDITVFKEGVSLSNILSNFLFLNGSVGWNSPLWFLVVLFLVDVVFLSLFKLKVSLKITIPVIFFIGFGLASTNIEYPFGMHILSWALVFYGLGHVCKEKNVIEKLNRTSLRTLSSLSILFLLNIVFGLVLNDRVSLYHNYLDNYFYFYIAALSGILFLFVLMNKLPANRFLKFFGKNTLLILATHYFMLYGYRAIDKLFFGTGIMHTRSYVSSILLAIFTLIMYYPLSYIFNKYLPFAVGRKKISIKSRKTKTSI